MNKIDQQVSEMKNHPQFDSFLREYASFLEEFHPNDLECDFEDMFLELMNSSTEISPQRRQAFVHAYQGMKAIMAVRGYMADLSFAQN